MSLSCAGWMENGSGKNPCTVAQEVGRLCNAEYNVSATNFQEDNYVPNATTANGCTCSWSIYNLMSACSYCVSQFDYPSWSSWIANCGDNVSNTSYLPSGLSFPEGIPYWAGRNPTQWYNGIFNVTEAANSGADAHPYLTGGPLPTSTSTPTSSPTPSKPVGPIVGGVIGAIAIIIIGGLIILWAVRRRQREKLHTAPISIPSFGGSPPITMPVPSIRSNRSVVRLGHTYVTIEPVQSTTSLDLMTSLVSPVSSGFSSGEQPLSDAADMISPYLVTSPTRQRNRSSTSLSKSKAAEALAERTITPPGSQRARMNPPPYSPSMDPGPSVSGEATVGTRRASLRKHKRWNASGSGATVHSGHSRTSTWENAVSVLSGPREEQNRSRTTVSDRGIVESMESRVSGDGMTNDDGVKAAMTHGKKPGASTQRPPVV